ncbi:hypothetical protein O181_072450 [Austropuccinia psidii MF-1]|uniref:Uncharacterized protein n=1 Tax=Austropuccinia psidii MF-1 TaxID=1389203 RepID=A0A9Q3IB21_9BASI|nr:hypothetical protein [Austropuccinia psidii MF-1]
MSDPTEKIPLFILDSNESPALSITHYTKRVVDLPSFPSFECHKDSSGIKSSASNTLATAANSVALVGEFKTPPLPPSVHIPSVMLSKSLLKSRDDIFKEIKGVGEDVAISSLHLFHWDMDLPPWRSSGMRRKSQKKLKLC